MSKAIKNLESALIDRQTPDYLGLMYAKERILVLVRWV
jgi:hypothetical protein